jgi:microfibrillar-associated protein 1
MPNPLKRFTANPARPVGRYRPGKAVAEQESSEEDESEEEQAPRKAPQRRPQNTRPPPARPATLKQVESEDDDEEGFVTDEDEKPAGVAIGKPVSSAKPTAPATEPTRPTRKVTEQRSDDEDESEDESSEEEEEDSSEEEAPRRKFQRPTFIKKSDRIQASATPAPSTEAGSSVTPAPDIEVDTQTRRLAQAELLIKDKLERDAIARAQGKKAWDDDDDIVPESMVDDTDGVDPEAEYAAWKLRELRRLKRDREALIAREKEIEEIERRRNLTAEEREKEDKAYLEKQNAEREENRQEASYMARYHHKGAFFQGDEAAEVLKRRNVMGARFEDDVSDKSLLPEYMRIRDMTKLGKKGRTRYTDMKNEDTGRFGDDVKRWRGSGGGPQREGRDNFDTRGLDERFLPDDQRGGQTGPTGANASVVAPRREGPRDDDRREQNYRNGDRSTYRPSDRHRAFNRSRERDRPRDQYRDSRKRSYSRSRSRSRSPRRRRVS